jgi:soluble cytochrome b562
MSVASISSTSFYQPSSVSANSRSRRAEFQQLGQDLQSGNLAAAQQDFSGLTQATSQTSGSTQTASSTAQIPGFGSMVQDLSTLGQAIQSGNLSAAQQAYKTVQQDMQSVQQSHGCHHVASAGTATASTTGGSATGTTSNSLLNLLSSSLANSSSFGAGLLSTGLSAVA